MGKGIGNRFYVDAEITDGPRVANVTSDNRLQVALPTSTQTIGNIQLTDATGAVAAISETNAQLTTGTRTKFREAFTTLDLVNSWTLTKDANDLVTIDGNAGGASYLKITKGLAASTETVLLSKRSFAVPCRMEFGASLSRRITGAQEYAVELVQVDDPGSVLEESYTPLALSALPVCQTAGTLIFATATAHGLNVGDRVALYGQASCPLNIGPVNVSSIPSSTTFGVPASGVTAGTYGSSIGGFVTKVGALARATHGMSALIYGNSTTSLDVNVRAGAGMALSASWATSVNHTTATIASQPYSLNQGYTYAATPSAMIEMLATTDHVKWTSNNIDTGGAAAATKKFDQVIVDPAKKCKIRIRALNMPNFPVIAGRITAAVKTSGSSIATLTVPNHGLTVNDIVYIGGIRDQTNFANTGIYPTISSVTDANTILVTIGSAVNATSYGGNVYKSTSTAGINGNTLYNAGTTASGAVQTISKTAAGRLQLLFNASPGTWAYGESVCVVGLVDAGGAIYPQYEGVYRLANYSASAFTVELDPLQNQDLSTLITPVNCGGSFVSATDFRIHFAALMDFTRQVVEIYAGKAHNDSVNAMPATIIGAGGAPGAGGALIGSVYVNSMLNQSALGTVFNTNVPAGSQSILPAVDYQGTNVTRSRYFATMSADRQCDYSIEHSGDATGYEIASPRIAATRQPGDVLAVSAMSRSGTTVTVTTIAHSYKVGQWVVVQGSTFTTLNFNGNFQVSAVPTATTFQYVQTSATETAGVTNATVTGSAKFYAQLSAPAIQRYARARVCNTSVLPTSTVTAAVRANALLVTLTTVASHGVAVGDVVGVSGMSDATNFPTLAGAVVLSTPMPTTLTVYWPGTNATSSGGILTPQNNTTFMYATLGATVA